MFLKCFVLLFTLENINGFHDHRAMENYNNINKNPIQTVKIELMYESLCPFSKKFHIEEFKQVVMELGQYLNVTPYPYGNAKTKVDENGHINITCQHGAKECYGNKMHACAIDSLKNITAAVIYNSCLMDFKISNGMSDDSAADKCGQLNRVNSKYIKSCAKSDKGLQLLKHYGELSKKYSYEGVPEVFIDGALYKDDLYFKRAVCKAFNNPPPECSW